MTDARLAEIEARRDEARSGPWELVNGNEGTEYLPMWVIVQADDDEGESFLEIHVGDRETGEFIAHAPEDVDYLLAEVKRLRSRGEVLIGIAKDRDQQVCPPGALGCPSRFVGFGRSCPAVCWEAWYNSTDEEWQAIREDKDGDTP
jgi:hypothetical protein